MKIFISHIHEEASLALALKEWLESSFAGQCDVFVSSDSDDIPPGAKWFDEIEAALEGARALIVLCSPVSLSRPWINFETGCGWMKRVPIIPLCHSGQRKSQLPQPIARFQALELEEPQSEIALIQALAKHLGFSKAPRIDASSMKRDLESARAKSKPTPAESSPEPASVGEVTPDMLSFLKFLAQLRREERPTSSQLASHFRLSHQRTEYILDRLKDAKLVQMSLVIGTGAMYSLSRLGREYLVEAGEL